MANSFEKYIGQSTDLDKVLCALMTSGVLETPEVQYVERGEFKIPVLEMDGLGNYDKATGFSSGNVSLTFETKKRNYERSKSFEIDAIDDMETMGVVTGNLMNEFMRTKVAPEKDLFTYSTLAKKDGIVKVSEDYATGVEVLEALRVATVDMDNNAVPTTDRYLFITPNNLSAAQLVDTYKSKGILDRFAGIIQVVPSVFKDNMTLSATNGYTIPAGTHDINFMIVSKSAVIKKTVHEPLRVFTPEVNQNKDAYKFQYRVNSIVETYDNKNKGIYCSVGTAASE